MWVELLTWLVSVPLIATAHEAGHALAARPAGYRVTSFGVGRGRPLLSHQTPGGVTFYLSGRLWTGGACVAIPLEPLPRGRWLYHAGGVLAQAALALALWPAAAAWPALAPVAGFNALVLLTNLIPWRVGPYTSDGWHLLVEQLRPLGAGALGQLFAARARVARIRGFERQVGSELGIAWCDLMLGWMDLQVGKDRDAAARMDWGELPLEPYLEAVHAYVLAELSRARDDPFGALRALGGFRGAELPDSAADLLTIAEARAYLTMNEPALARQSLSRVAGVSGVVGREALAVLLEIALVSGALETIEVCARRLADRIDGPLLDPALAVAALWEAQRQLHAAGRSAAAPLKHRAARTAARLLAVAAVEDRVSLVQRLGEAGGVKEKDAAGS